jgi:hypothetical protein
MAEVIEIIEAPKEVIEVIEGVGPQGAIGPVGPAGAVGPQGVKGDPGVSEWSQITGKPTTFDPSAHSHLISEVSDLQTALDGKAGSLYSSAIPDHTFNTLVGGATPEPASTWKSRTIVQALDKILFPTVLPWIRDENVPSLTLSVSGLTGVQEVGTPVQRTLTVTFNRGRITNGDGSLGPEVVGAAGTPEFTGTGLTTTTNNNNLGVIPVEQYNNEWLVSLPYTAGTGAYFDNKGAISTNLDGWRYAGTEVASTGFLGVMGVYPWYYIKSPVTFTAAQFGAAITALGNGTSGTAINIHASATIAKVVADAGGTLSVPYNVSNQFVGVAHDSALTSKTAFFVSALNSGSITGPFKTEETQNNVAQASTSPRWTRNFKVLVSKNPQTDSATTLELRNTL